MVQEVVDQLAGAIEEEIEQLGGHRLPDDEAVLQIAKVHGVGRVWGAD